MKKSIFIFFSVLFTFCSFKLYSQDTNIVKYLPINLGNVWVYHYTGTFQQGSIDGFIRYAINGPVTKHTLQLSRQL